ncbi:hypothetical protein JXA32_12255 [Candidatus Sumerlaeota bacterium]|nr:hypothetical protein [Candidatus Sumerlaeota bacterium]
MNPAFEKMIQGKSQRRKELSALPWPEKVRILIQMQRMIVPIVRHRDSRACVWSIAGEDNKAAS